MEFKSFFKKKTLHCSADTRIPFDALEAELRTCIRTSKHAGSARSVAFRTGTALHNWQHGKDDCWISGVENATNRIAVFFV
jgi:tRNA threonylcarbamoyladenosine modification (KEOPS) complex Cgi121 subunit